MQWEISSSVFTCCESVTEWMPFSFSVCSSSLVLGSFFNSEIDEKQETMHLKWFQRDSYFYSLPYCQGCPLAGNEVYSQLMSCPAVTACVWWGLLVGCCCLQEYGCWCCGHQVLWKRCCCQPWICSNSELCSASLWISTKELFLISRSLRTAKGKSQHSAWE